MHLRNYVTQRLEKLEGTLKKVEYWNGRRDQREVENAKTLCEELVADIKSAIEREPRTPNELNRY
jgi:hypothetical protein